MLNKYQRDKLRNAYSEEFLLQELLESAVELADAEFSKFHYSILQNFFTGIQFERVAICRQHAGAETSGSQAGPGNPDRSDASPRIRAENSHASHGRRMRADTTTIVAQFDADDGHGPQSGLISGNVSKSPTTSESIFIAIYCIPNRKDQRISFEYFAINPVPTDWRRVKHSLHYLSVPFYFCWLMRLGFIDGETLADWLGLLVGVTPSRLRLLREIVNAQRYQTAVIARKMSLSDRVVRNYISEALNSISHLLPEPELKGANNSQCVDLVRYYWFLRYVGTA